MHAALVQLPDVGYWEGVVLPMPFGIDICVETVGLNVCAWPDAASNCMATLRASRLNITRLRWENKRVARADDAGNPAGNIKSTS